MHLAHHNKQRIPVVTPEKIPEFCQRALEKLRCTLPKVEASFRASKSPKPEDVRNLCDFYIQVLEGGFCPNAPHLFELGKGGTESTLYLVVDEQTCVTLFFLEKRSHSVVVGSFSPRSCTLGALGVSSHD